jgi:hypothetical protein
MVMAVCERTSPIPTYIECARTELVPSGNKDIRKLSRCRLRISGATDSRAPPTGSFGNKSALRRKDFKAFHIEQAKGFKRDLSDQRSHRSGQPLSKAILYATLTALKRLFVWLAGQLGFKSRISYSDAEYFNLSTKETRIAKTDCLSRSCKANQREATRPPGGSVRGPR